MLKKSGCLNAFILLLEPNPADVNSIIAAMYSGSVKIDADNEESILKLARQLKVKIEIISPMQQLQLDDQPKQLIICRKPPETKIMKKPDIFRRQTVEVPQKISKPTTAASSRASEHSFPVNSKIPKRRDAIDEIQKGNEEKNVQRPIIPEKRQTVPIFRPNPAEAAPTRRMSIRLQSRDTNATKGTVTSIFSRNVIR
jgi:hypothetical protein